MSLAEVYMSGEVRRWHANPALAGTGQTIADHQGRCAQLLLTLHPAPSKVLIDAVLHHDVGERWAGDLPKPFKDTAPGLANLHAEVERNLRCHAMERALSAGLLSRTDADWLTCVDCLEAYCFMVARAPGEIDRNGWPAARAAIVKLSARLECNKAVVALLNDMEAGRW